MSSFTLRTVAIIVTLFIHFAAPSKAAPEALYDYLFTSKKFPDSIAETVKVATLEQDRIDSLLHEVPGAVLFLPTNDAWQKKSGWIEALLKEPEGNVRYELILAAAADTNAAQVGSDWSSLEKHAEANGGVLDSAYGSPYFLKSDVGVSNLCLAEWEGGRYVEGECASVQLPPITLEDATIYLLDSVLVPKDLEASIISLTARRR